MKKFTFLSLLLVLFALCFALVGCGEDENADDGKGQYPISYKYNFIIDNVGLSYIIEVDEDRSFSVNVEKDEAIISKEPIFVGSISEENGTKTAEIGGLIFKLNDETQEATYDSFKEGPYVLAGYEVLAGEYLPQEGFVPYEEGTEGPTDTTLTLNADGSGYLLSANLKYYPLENNRILLVEEDYDGMVIDLDVANKTFNTPTNNAKLTFTGAYIIDKYYDFFFADKNYYFGEGGVEGFTLRISDKYALLENGYDQFTFCEATASSGVFTLATYNRDADGNMSKETEVLKLYGDKLDMPRVEVLKNGNYSISHYEGNVAYACTTEINEQFCEVVETSDTDVIVLSYGNSTYVYRKSDLAFIEIINKRDSYIDKKDRAIYTEPCSGTKLIIDKASGRALIQNGENEGTIFYTFEEINLAGEIAFICDQRGYILVDDKYYFSVDKYEATDLFNNLYSAENINVAKYKKTTFIRANANFDKTTNEYENTVVVSSDSFFLLFTFEEDENGNITTWYPEYASNYASYFVKRENYYILDDNDSISIIMEKENNELYINSLLVEEGVREIMQFSDGFISVRCEERTFVFDKTTGIVKYEIYNRDHPGFSGLEAIYPLDYDPENDIWNRYHQPIYLCLDFLYAPTSQSSFGTTYVKCDYTDLDILDNRFIVTEVKGQKTGYILVEGGRIDINIHPESNFEKLIDTISDYSSFKKEIYQNYNTADGWFIILKYGSSMSIVNIFYDLETATASQYTYNSDYYALTETGYEIESDGTLYYLIIKNESQALLYDNTPY